VIAGSAFAGLSALRLERRLTPAQNGTVSSTDGAGPIIPGGRAGER